MNLCDYGCGNEGIYQLKNGKWCCHKSPNSCPKNIEKNSKNIGNIFIKNALFVINFLLVILVDNTMNM